jgi:hypothetical protein
MPLLAPLSQRPLSALLDRMLSKGTHMSEDGSKPKPFIPSGPAVNQEGQPSRKAAKPPKPRKVEKRQRGRKG